MNKATTSMQTLKLVFLLSFGANAILKCPKLETEGGCLDDRSKISTREESQNSKPKTIAASVAVRPFELRSTAPSGAISLRQAFRRKTPSRSSESEGPTVGSVGYTSTFLGSPEKEYPQIERGNPECPSPEIRRQAELPYQDYDLITPAPKEGLPPFTLHFAEISQDGKGLVSVSSYSLGALLNCPKSGNLFKEEDLFEGGLDPSERTFRQRNYEKLTIPETQFILALIQKIKYASIEWPEEAVEKLCLWIAKNLLDQSHANKFIIKDIQTYFEITRKSLSSTVILNFLIPKGWIIKEKVYFLKTETLPIEVLASRCQSLSDSLKGISEFLENKD